MAKSTDYIKMTHPIDAYNHEYTMKSDKDADFTPGVLVTPDANDLAVLADVATAAHRVGAKYLTNIDVGKRGDANNAGLTRAGVRQDVVDLYRLKGARILCHVARTFDATTPALGKIVAMSFTTPGKLGAFTPAALATAFSGASITDETEKRGVVLGRVAGPVGSDGYVPVEFD